MMRTDDPISDFMVWDTQREKQLQRLPVCNVCGEPIQDEHFYLINDENICLECMEYNFKKRTEDFEG